MSAIVGRLPIVGEFISHVKEKQKVEVARDIIRLAAVAVAAVALGFFPALTTRVANTPYVGILLAKFQLLTPITQGLTLGLISLPALSLATGGYFVYSAVSVAVQARFTLDLITSLDLAAKLLTGVLLIRSYRQLNMGLVEIQANESQATYLRVKSA